MRNTDEQLCCMGTTHRWHTLYADPMLFRSFTCWLSRDGDESTHERDQMRRPVACGILGVADMVCMMLAQVQLEYDEYH